MQDTNNPSDSRSRRKAPEGRWRAWFCKLVLFCGISVYLEICLQIFLFGGIVRHSIYAALFGALAGAVITLLVSLLPRVLQRIAALLFVLLQTVLAETQLIYHAVFGNLMPMSQLRLGGGVLKSFYSQMFYAIRMNLLPFLLLFLPLLVLIVLMIWKRILRIRIGWKQALATLGLMAAGVGLIFGLMRYCCRHTIPVMKLLVSDTTSTDMSYENLGMHATTVQELRFMFFGSRQFGADLVQGDLDAVPDLYDPEEYNVIPGLNLKALAETAENEELALLDNYFAARTPTKKNDDTGRMRDYNVIEICAESYCPWFITEELTPTLYKLSHSGLVFENYYGTYNSMTSNGEYLLCLGLYPDVSRWSTNTSFEVSVGHTLPFCLGTALREAGYVTYAYHNYLGEFYNRMETHANMGYTFKSSSSGLDITIQWPASDLEMMQASVDDYLYADQPFHAYYMTFSGHYQYNWENAMSAKHRDEVKDLPYNETVQAYIACNLELENALTYLLDRLEGAGKLDSTVIVLTNDHYPYGLVQKNYENLLGHPVDQVFEKYQNSFICFAPGLGETRTIDSYCSTADILPTMLNLLGVTYDSRLLAGTDVLSDCTHIAVLADQSYLTAEFRYNAATGEVISADPAAPVDRERVQALCDEVTARFAFSRDILYADYYAHICRQTANPVTDDSGVLFLDAPDVNVQADMLFLYNKGLLDMMGERKIGVKQAATVGHYVTAVYRYLGSPNADPEHLPEDYLADCSEEIRDAFPEDASYAAVCWAFETGLLRPEDRCFRYDDPLDNVAACLLMYRTASFLDWDMEADLTVLQDLDIRNDGLTEEEQQAIAWCLGHRTFRPEAEETLEGVFDADREPDVTRARMSKFLIWVLFPGVETKP